MSYWYEIDKNLTISNERLTILAHRYGYKDVKYNNIHLIADDFSCETGNDVVVNTDIDTDTGITVFSLEIGHLGKMSESDGINGIVRVIKRYQGIVDPMTVMVTDEHGQKAQAELT